ncbi:MAG: cytochrome c family protein [Candidatus Methylomirabilales bacterium]
MRCRLTLLAALLIGLPAGQVVLAAGPVPRAFAKCYACHSADPAERDLPGPNLHALFGRRAGALPGFEFSRALREAGRRGLVWTEEALDRFLRDPQAVVPGTTMAPPPLRDDGERRAVIEYLKREAG